MARLIAAIILLWALLPNPYGFCMLVRLGVCGYAGYRYAQHDLSGLAWLFGVITVAYNPLLPVYLTREIWMPVDLFTAGLLVWSVVHDRRRAT
jgi:hypothetical protein